MMLRQCTNFEGVDTDWIWARLQDGLSLLAIGYRYASASDVNSQEFAVRYKSLCEAGLNECDVRWLLTQDFVEHLVELTLPGDTARSFRAGGAAICTESCLRLTEHGFAFAQQGRSDGCDSDASNNQTSKYPAATNSAQPIPAIHPVWNPDRQELSFQNQIIKRYRLPSPNQTAILSAFEEDDWPVRIDDPLSPRLDQDPKRRLHDTIRNLNRAQIHPLLRFVGDGSGQGVLWDRVR
ncbi:hypothetical protein [Novipirellula maiorica]|nr:hypothetical protein [Rhodopirellula maiorica]